MSDDLELDVEMLVVGLVVGGLLLLAGKRWVEEQIPGPLRWLL